MGAGEFPAVYSLLYENRGPFREGEFNGSLEVFGFLDHGYTEAGSADGRFDEYGELQFPGSLLAYGGNV